MFLINGILCSEARDHDSFEDRQNKISLKNEGYEAVWVEFC